MYDRLRAAGGSAGQRIAQRGNRQPLSMQNIGGNGRTGPAPSGARRLLGRYRNHTGPSTSPKPMQTPIVGGPMRPRPGGGAGEKQHSPATGSEGTRCGTMPGSRAERRRTEGRDPATAAEGSMADRGPKWTPAARSGHTSRPGSCPEGWPGTASRIQINAAGRPVARATEESRPAQRNRAKAAGGSLRHAVLPPQGETKGRRYAPARRTGPIRDERQRGTGGPRVGTAAVR